MENDRNRALRSLPSVDALTHDTSVIDARGSLSPEAVTAIVRRAIDEARTAIVAGELGSVDRLPDRVARDLQLLDGRRTNLVINGTGVIIQTNLGRAPVSTETAAAMADAATNYLALETDLETGERGGRGATIEAMMAALTGAERTLVVNNNAAAVLLTLAATSAGRGVIVSRGEAVEIGGGFRVPDVLRQSGALLVEVGTTNRTYARDYEAAIDMSTAALLRVHASNFAITGFVARPELTELAELARYRGILTIEDVGSGCLLDTARYGLDHEPTLAESVAAGVDVICASGDKLLGGPQAGLIVGRAEVVERIRRHPLARAVRADKTCLAGIEATLRHYLRGDAEETVPVWWSMSRSTEWLQARVAAWVSALGERASIVTTDAVVGGGSLPGKTLPSVSVAIRADAPDALAKRLRLGSTPVVSRIVDGQVAIDARTVLAGQDDAMLSAVQSALM